MKTWVAIQFSTIFFLAVGSFAQSPQNQRPLGQMRQSTYVLSGTVSMADGSAAANAHIEVRELTTGISLASGPASPSGAFEYTLSGGMVEVIATEGLQEVRERVNLHNGFSTLVLRLPASQDSNVNSKFSVSVAQYQVPRKARDAFHKAQIAATKMKIDDVKKYLAEALEIYPDFAEALTLRGILHLDANEMEAARTDLEKAVDSDHSYAMAYLALGATYNLLKRFDDAIRIADRGVTLSPASWQGYFELGKAYMGKADYKAAIPPLNRAQELAPKHYSLVHLVKAHAWLSLKDYASAMSELQIFLQHAPHSEADSKEALIMLEQAQASTQAAAR